MQINKKEITIIILLTLLITFMDISGIPAVLFVHFTVADVSPFIIPLMINFLLIGVIAFLALRFLCPDWRLGLTAEGLREGIRKYALAGILAGVFSGVAFWAGLRPFDYTPTIWKVLLEGVLYYVGVGVIEEMYVRGLFLNAVEKLACKSKNSTNIAIVVSSVVFGLGHVPGMLGLGALVILFKVISTIGMGLYFGVIYKKTDNLWVPIIMHIFIDVCALPYCFTTFSGYKTVSLIGLVVIYILLGAYSIRLMCGGEKKK